MGRGQRERAGQVEGARAHPQRERCAFVSKGPRAKVLAKFEFQSSSLKRTEVRAPSSRRALRRVRARDSLLATAPTSVRCPLSRADSSPVCSNAQVRDLTKLFGAVVRLLCVLLMQPS